MTDITGVDQEPPDDEQQDQETPDENKNEHNINYRTEEVGDLIEDKHQSNEYLQPQEKEPEQLLETTVPAPTRCSTRSKKPVSRIVP